MKRSVAVCGVNGTTVTGTGVYSSLTTVVGKDGRLTYRCKFTQTVASLAGAILVKVSQSTEKEIADSLQEWDTYDLVTPPSIAGTTSGFILKLTHLPEGTLVKLQYTNSTGTGLWKANARTS